MLNACLVNDGVLIHVKWWFDQMLNGWLMNFKTAL